MPDVRRARPEEFPAVRAFYHRLIDLSAAGPYPLGWQKDVYPAPEQLRQALERGQLYIGEQDGKILAAMILDREGNAGYQGAPWRVEAMAAQVSVIHALGVTPACQGQGLGRQMVRAAQKLALAQGSRALRLDVLSGNLPAERLYLGMGFYRVAGARMFYPDTGWTEFDLYEYDLTET